MTIDFAKAMPLVAEALLGKPVKTLSRGNEWRYGKQGSMEVRVDSGLWHDHESDAKGGTLGLIEHIKGIKGREAIEWMRGIGVDVGDAPAPKTNGAHRPNGHANGHSVGAAVTPRGPTERKATGKREIVETYPFRDFDGTVIYEEVRFQTKLPNGEWETENGKPTKTIRQRRPDPDKPGEWLWNLDGVAHSLYDYSGIREEMLANPSERRTIFIPEGPRKCEVLKAWGLLATSNSGGAANWRPDHAQHLAGADVVLLLDNDEAGRKRGDKLAASLIEAKARVRLLDFRDWWPGVPPKGDIVDWRDKAGGTAEKLYQIIDKLKVWAPQRERRFKRLSLFEISKREIKTPDYVVEDWLVAREVSFIGGAPQSGKTFCATHLGLCIATGREVFGRKVAQGLVIYQTGESGSGLLDQRIPAWLQHYGDGIDENAPFEVLPSRVDLFHPEKNDTAELIDCIKKIASEYQGVPLRAVFIDTFAKAIRGGDETKGVDVGRVLENVERIAAETGAHVCVIHHVPKGGVNLRGHTSLRGDVDTVVFVENDEETKIRTISADKIKDGPSDWKIQFSLLVKVIAQQLDGKEITSCVCIPMGAEERKRKAVEAKGFVLNTDEKRIFNAVLAALKDKGDIARENQVADGVPPGTICVHFRDWRDAYIAQRAPDEEGSLTNGAVRKVWERRSISLTQYSVIGYSKGWIWRLPKAIRGYPGTMDRSRTESVQPRYNDEPMEF